MWPFEKSATAVAEPESVIDPREERLRQLESELPGRIAARDQVRKELMELRRSAKDPRMTIVGGVLFTSFDALTHACPHALLEKAQHKLDAEVDSLLRERGQLLMQTGAVR